MKLRNWVYLILAVLLVFAVNTITFGAGSFTDTFSIGKNPASGSDVTLELGAGKVKYSPTEKKLKYANDGVNFSSIGSGGSAGGINILKNPSFEDVSGSTILNWNTTGLTATTTTFTAGVEGDVKYVTLTATSASQTFCSDFVTTPDTFSSAGGQFDFQYMGSGSKFRAYILSSTGTITTPTQLMDVNTTWTKFLPQSLRYGASQRVCFESLAAGSMSINDAYMGSVKSIASSSSSKYVGSITFKNCNNNWLQTSTSFADFAALTSCTVTTRGNVKAPPTYIPAIVLPSIQSGLYKIEAEGFFYGGNGAMQYLRFFDGLQTSSEISGYGLQSVTNLYMPSISHTMYYTAPQGETTLRLQALTSNSTYMSAVYVSGSTQTFTINVYYYPDAEDVGQTPSQAEWFIDANMGGSGIASFGTSSSYTEITGTTIDLVNNTAVGSAPVKIACANGYPSSGTTCASSNESIGLSFIPPTVGVYEVCVNPTTVLNVQAASASNGPAVTYEVNLVNSAGTILQEGLERPSISVQKETLSYTQQWYYFNNKVCGVFKFTDISEKTVKLMAESYIPSASAAYLIADRSGTFGQRDLHWTVRPVLSSNSRMILTGDQVTSPNVKNPIHFKVRYGTGSASTACTAGPCSYTDSIGADDILSYVGRSSLGTYGLYTTKTWNKLFCTGNAFVGGRYLAMQPCSTVNGSACTFATGDATTGYDSYGTLDCLGY